LLENAWVIPALPILSFFLILFFGKRLPKGGAWIGVAALGAAFALSVVAVGQWVSLPKTLEVASHSEAAGHGEEAGHAEDAPAGGAQEGESHDEEGPEVGHAAPAEAGEEGHGEGHAIREPVRRTFTWYSNGPIDIDVGFHIDGLAVVMLFVVTAISFAVHIFSTNYMADDVRITHYFAALSLFTAGMLVMVTASTTLLLLFGWEAMGLCSFMLIGHWWEKKENSNAALKAFFTTRTGDVGLLVGISILFFAAGQTFDIATLNEQALTGGISKGVLTIGAIALFCGVIGKSAQFPLHTWLPDAMAGPTPVSALIHAATMVVAGVYLVARVYGVFWEGFSIEAGGVNLGAVVGGVTVLIAALLAFVQTDIKRVLAYSTVSQLGYMVMALCVGAWTAGIFHLFTHAMFKALLFLGSGSVSHAVHTFDMREMGGLRKFMPTTFKTFIVGSIALAGIPPLAGFWSKDEILVGAQEGGYPIMLVMGLIGAAMTAAYMTRCVWLTFFGEYRGHGHPHESPAPITVPLIALSVMAIGAGFLNAPGIGLFTDWTDNAVVLTAGVEHHDFSITTAAIGTLVALVGIVLAGAYYVRNVGPHGLTDRSSAARAGYTFLLNRYYLDHLYTGGVVGGIKGPIARAAYWFNQNVIDAIANGIGIFARGSGNFVYNVLDQRLVDGAVNGSAYAAGAGGGFLRTIQTGRVQHYAAVLFAATAIFAAVLIFVTI
jgi:NADH-quinone oxidoreductase subunit L